MRSTFRVLFYTKNQSIKNGKVPVMGRITINKTTACFSCKKEVSISLWDAKANRAKGKSEEARMLNQELDNAKAQIAKHYQYICDHDSFVTAKKVYSRYVGFKEDSHTLMELFREQLESYKEKVGKEKAKSTYLGLVADYKSALLFLKDKKNVEDIALDELDKDFIEDYYNWMLGTCGSASSTAFGRVNTMKWLMHIAQEKGLISLRQSVLIVDMSVGEKETFSIIHQQGVIGQDGKVQQHLVHLRITVSTDGDNLTGHRIETFCDPFRVKSLRYPVPGTIIQDISQNTKHSALLLPIKCQHLFQCR